MTVYRPCHNCAHDRNECVTLANMKRGLAGLHVTSVKFNCPDRAPVYRPGDRVSVSWPVADGDGYYEDYALETWPATVVEEKGARFVIAVDDVVSDYETPARDYIKNQSLYCKVSAAKLKPLKEPKRSVCGICGIVGGSSLAGCWQNCVTPQRGCLRAITEAAQVQS